MNRVFLFRTIACAIALLPLCGCRPKSHETSQTGMVSKFKLIKAVLEYQ